MIAHETKLVCADNTGARTVECIGIPGHHRHHAHVGDIIKVTVKEAQPTGVVKKGEVHSALIVRTAHPLRRSDGSTLRFDTNAVVIVDAQNNPKGTRVFGPVARELRDRHFMKVVSLAQEVL
jgi:large subunit ribosomal protein L14